MKSKAQPRHRQDSQQDKDAQAARFLMETWPTRHPRVTGCTGLHPDTGKDNAQRQGESAPDVAGSLLLEAWRGSSIARSGGVPVNRPS